MVDFFSLTRLRQAASLSALLLATASAAQAQAVTFALQPNSPSSGGYEPLSLAAGDVNGDGRPDALLANGNSHTLGVLLGNGAGGFTLQPNLPGTGGYRPEGVVLADVNADGRPDALVANSSGTIGVLLNVGAGNFTLQASPPSTGGGSPRALAVADVNGDGRPDLLAANEYTNTLAVLLGDGAGGFTLQPNSPATGATAGPAPYGLAVVDVNADGRPDALLTSAYGSTLSVLLGNGAGRFTLQPNPASTGPNGGPTTLVITDANGDGRPDALVANTASATLGVLLGDGAGHFALQPNSPSTGAGTYPRALALADVNGDARPDVLVVNQTTNTLGVLLGNGSGGFTLQPNAASTGSTSPTGRPSTPAAVAAADANGDGRPDALVVDFGLSQLSVLLNTTAYTPLATSAALPGATATLHPNPAANYATLTLGGLPTPVVQVQATLLDATGRAMRQCTLAAGQGRAHAEVLTTGLAPGLYVLRLAALDAVGAPAGVLPTQRLSVR